MNFYLSFPFLCFFILLMGPKPALAKKDLWQKDKRASYIATALAVLEGSDKEVLKEAKDKVLDDIKGDCRSSILDIKVKCLMEEADRFCFSKGKDYNSCLVYHDILIANKLSISKFISARERYRIYKEKGRSKDVFDALLTERYAKIAADFSLSESLLCFEKTEPCFAKSIDHFCLDISKKGLYPWQSCVSALLWFMTDKKG